MPAAKVLGRRLQDVLTVREGYDFACFAVTGARLKARASCFARIWMALADSGRLS